MVGAGVELARSRAPLSYLGPSSRNPRFEIRPCLRAYFSTLTQYVVNFKFRRNSTQLFRGNVTASAPWPISGQTPPGQTPTTPVASSKSRQPRLPDFHLKHLLLFPLSLSLARSFPVQPPSLSHSVRADPTPLCHRLSGSVLPLLRPAPGRSLSVPANPGPLRLLSVPSPARCLFPPAP
jgi:hypothetical protein